LVDEKKYLRQTSANQRLGNNYPKEEGRCSINLSGKWSALNPASGPIILNLLEQFVGDE
jgi:hypothetical protein